MENENQDELLDFEIEEQDEVTPEEDTITLSKGDYKKLDRKARAYDAGKQTTPKPTVKNQPYDTSIFEDKLARLELKSDGYSDESIDFAMKFGGKEALQNPYVKTAIDTIQEQKRAEQALTSNESTKSDIERKMTQAEIQALSAEELYKLLPKAQK